MKHSGSGFTLIELLIVIAIIGILAAVLIPNLINARTRAFDVAAQVCLKELATRADLQASLPLWTYEGAPTPAEATALNLQSCSNVTIGGSVPTISTYLYTAQRQPSTRVWQIQQGRGVALVN